MSKFLPESEFKQIDHKELDLNQYTNNSSKECALDADLEDPKELQGLHNDYPLATDKIEIKREVLSEYQLNVADLYNISIGKLKNQCLTFLIKRRMWFVMKTRNFSSDQD